MGFSEENCTGYKSLSALDWDAIDKSLIGLVGDTPLDENKVYTELFRYFLTGFYCYRTGSNALAKYPGARSFNGKFVDRLEGFTRIAPLLGAWLKGGRSDIVQLSDVKAVSVLELLYEGLRAGTDPKNPFYWGQAGPHDQRVCEAADVALALWLARSSLWPRLSVNERDQILDWLRIAANQDVKDNNWHLFPLFTKMVVNYFVSGDNLTSDNHHFHRIFDFYVGAGWFSDGVDGPIDYYNAWGFHYSLYWISEILSGRECDVVLEALIDFVNYFKYFITLDGFPILGRSICYRTAVVAPLVAAGSSPWSDLDPGVSRRALWATWKHFIERGSLKHGVLTQGYWKTDLRLVDNYSGPASSLWGLRSLVIALAQPPCSTFWSAPMVPLPIEKGDFEFVIDPIGWKITGDHADHDVRITVLANRECELIRLSNYSLMRRISGCLAKSPKRPPNNEAKYGLRTYSAKRPFFVQ